MANITNVLSTNPSVIQSNKTTTTSTANSQQNTPTNSSDSLPSTPAYLLAGNLATINSGVLQGSSTEQSTQMATSVKQTTSTTTGKNSFDSLVSSPAYSLAGNLATKDLTLLQGLSSSESDDTLFYKPSNNLDFLSGSTFKSLVNKTLEQSQSTASTKSTTTNEQFNPAKPFDEAAASKTASVLGQFNPADPFANVLPPEIVSSVRQQLNLNDPAATSTSAQSALPNSK